jgi:hypothetical protein
MMYFFIAGLFCGGSLALIVLVGKLFSYRKQLLIARSSLERLERHNSDLQLQLHELQRLQRQQVMAQERADALRDVA